MTYFMKEPALVIAFLFFVVLNEDLTVSNTPMEQQKKTATQTQ